MELPTTATRRPFGSGWWAMSSAVSNICGRVCTRMTPACSNSACTLDSSIDAATEASDGNVPVCRPDFTAMTGLVRASLRATRANLRGLPKVSRYSSTCSVFGSVCQYCIRSLPDTSARLPADTNDD